MPAPCVTKLGLYGMNGRSYLARIGLQGEPLKVLGKQSLVILLRNPSHPLNVAAPANPLPPKKLNLKRKSSDDDSDLFALLGQLHADTNARLDTLASRIGYEMDLGTAGKEIFRHLGNIPELTDYDLCDIIGMENSRLEIFTGLPDASKPGCVKHILEKEARY
ncbi:hypothetical protein SASPL_105421 [Salvia splendens]|uniref:Uncharacterized protein n=1 Tax=Salvia splendens TaxID=180675 RepID=A0A8X8YL21_SALSN|nr:hypothetical protein SASPL_105421 [Salvia splendens]